MTAAAVRFRGAISLVKAAERMRDGAERERTDGGTIATNPHLSPTPHLPNPDPNSTPNSTPNSDPNPNPSSNPNSNPNPNPEPNPDPNPEPNPSPTTTPTPSPTTTPTPAQAPPSRQALTPSGSSRTLTRPEP